MAHPFVMLAAIWLVLAVPAMIGERSWKRLGYVLLVSALGVILPLIVFFFSVFLVPDWKGACAHGWIDCFHTGKLALAPLVLWATGALYVLEVGRVKPPYGRALVLGLFTGALVAGGCFLYGLIFVGGQMSAMTLWLGVPLYTATWHGIRAMQVAKVSPFKLASYVTAFCGSIPFWIGSVLWSRRVYEALPDKASECFIVTAAGCGHQGFVGPFVEVERRGHSRIVNHQLITLWQLEVLWQDRAPRSHAILRPFYNRCGPAIARRITSPWLADATHVALKPAEWLAKALLHIDAKNHRATFKVEKIHETN